MQQARADIAVMKMVDLTPSANVGHKSQKPLVLCDFMGTCRAAAEVCCDAQLVVA